MSYNEHCDDAVVYKRENPECLNNYQKLRRDSISGKLGHKDQKS